MRKESKSMGARGYAMSDFSPTLVLQTSIAKSPNDMANVQIKSEKLTPFGGKFPIMEQFDILWDQTTDPHRLHLGIEIQKKVQSRMTGLFVHP